MSQAPALARFWSRVDKRGPDECWPWLGHIGAHGYGHMNMDGRRGGRKFTAQRASYTLLIGPIPTGLEIDHLCHTNAPDCPGGPCPHRSCVNPAHLEAVTHRVNLLRGRGVIARNASATHCPQGHPYSGPNLMMDRGRKQCRACHNGNRRARRAAAEGAR